MRTKGPARLASAVAVAGFLFSCGGCGPDAGGTAAKPAAHQGKDLRKMEDFMKSKGPKAP